MLVFFVNAVGRHIFVFGVTNGRIAIRPYMLVFFVNAVGRHIFVLGDTNGRMQYAPT
ncbi:MAG: hypothetical protein OIF50_10815 [Flavobacteriaceae bacterium]|nr:hypothetical protein [Flavobacteriaceae bacterium]